MDKEEKAKAYDEALERAKKLYNEAKANDYTSDMEDYETIFPELKENEDEKIRRNIIAALKGEGYYDCDLTNECIAWVEKQGQTFTKKDVDDAYLKGIFDTKQGKQDARYKYLEEIIAADDIYQMAMNDAMVNEAKEKAAKALSKLGIGKLLGFENQGEQNPTSDTRYEVGADGSLSVNASDYKYATITQNDFASKEELKKIDDEIEIPFGAKDSELQEETYYIPKGFHAIIDGDKVVIKKGEKSAEWSEEDELRFNCTVGYLERMNDANGGIFLEDIDWLKSLKDRIG